MLYVRTYNITLFVYDVEFISLMRQTYDCHRVIHALMWGCVQCTPSIFWIIMYHHCAFVAYFWTRVIPILHAKMFDNLLRNSNLKYVNQWEVVLLSNHFISSPIPKLKLQYQNKCRFENQWNVYNWLSTTVIVAADAILYGRKFASLSNIYYTYVWMCYAQMINDIDGIWLNHPNQNSMDLSQTWASHSHFNCNACIEYFQLPLSPISIDRLSSDEGFHFSYVVFSLDWFCSINP